MWIVLVFIVIVIAISSIVPIIQYLIWRKKNVSEQIQYFFSRSLVDFDIDTEFKSDNENRFALANRGWIRCPSGTVLSNEAFERKKMDEYDIPLP